MSRPPQAPPIAVNLITGFLGVGKTTAIRHLLNHVPPGQQWAVLVNEVGEVGVDGALLDDGREVAVQEVAGGCLCCVAAPAFTTGLNRLIRQYRPQRILIEPSGLGHPAQVLDTLSGPLYADVLSVLATVCLLDARHLRSERHLAHPNFVDQIHLADVLVANKGDLYAAADFAALEEFVIALQPAKRKIAVTERGMLDPNWLELGRGTDRRAAFPEAHAFLLDHGEPRADAAAQGSQDWVMLEGRGDGYQRAGWLMRTPQPWPAERLGAFIAGLDAERKKGLFDTDRGWLALNQTDWSKLEHPPADRRSRLELLDPAPLDVAAIDTALRRLSEAPG